MSFYEIGIGLWSQDGYTAQINREDTLPKRLSPGQIVLPGLNKLANAADYHGRLDLYNVEFVESGGGMTATTWVDDSVDVMVVDVKGADPAELKLWIPRKPEVIVDGKNAALAETWRDTTELGSTGLTFGSMAAVTAEHDLGEQGRQVAEECWMNAAEKKRTVLVTGGSRGLGTVMALELAATGAHLAVNYFNRRDAAETDLRNHPAEWRSCSGRSGRCSR